VDLPLHRIARGWWQNGCVREGGKKEAELPVGTKREGGRTERERAREDGDREREDGDRQRERGWRQGEREDRGSSSPDSDVLSDDLWGQAVFLLVVEASRPSHFSRGLSGVGTAIVVQLQLQLRFCFTL
jgi:hypothetical protein